MRVSVLLAAVAMLAAGCAGQAPGAEDLGASNETVVFTEDYALGNETIAVEDLRNATLGAEHEHDAWNGAEQLVLLDESLEAGDCEGAMDAAFYAIVRAFEGEAAYGCVRASLPEGTLVPEGAASLSVEIDATQSLKSGSLAFQWRNKAHEAETETTDQPKHAWNVTLAKEDWDVPHAPATTFVMYVAARGPVGVFQGPIHVRILAHRIPGWEPVLAVAHVDHWKLPTMHDFPAPGVMKLLDAEDDVTNVDPARFLGTAEEHEGLVLADIIAPGTAHVAIVTDTAQTDCAPILTCHLVPQLHVGGYDRDRFGTLVHEEGARRVYVWKVPDEVPYDSVYQETSTTAIESRIDACVTGQPDTCGLASVASGSAKGRYQAFAIQGDVDLELLLALAGPAA